MRNEHPYDSVLDTIGWTPMIRLNRITRGIRTPILAKAEFFNPASSVKDRLALNVIEAAERAAALSPGQTVVGDQRQHRYRARHGLYSEGLSTRGDHGR